MSSSATMKKNIVEPDLGIAIGKLLAYSSVKRYDAGKFSKYIKMIRTMTNSSSSQEISPSKSQSFTYSVRGETTLRKKGGLEAIASVLKRIGFQKDIDLHPENKGKEFQYREAIVEESLTLLGNSFARDSEARREASKYDLITVLQTCLEKPSLFTTNVDVIRRKALKCLGNLCANQIQERGSGNGSKNENVSWWTKKIVRSGILVSVLEVIKDIKKSTKVQNLKIKSSTSVTSAATAAAGGGKDDISKLVEFRKEKVDLLAAAVRALRILALDVNVQIQLSQLDGFVVVGEILIWSFAQQKDLLKEVLSALTYISSSGANGRVVQREMVFDIEVKEVVEPILIELIKLFKETESDEMMTLKMVPCLINLAKNKYLLGIFQQEQIFNVIFRKIDNSDDFTVLEPLVRLLQELVIKDSSIQHYLLPHSSQAGSTLKILKSPELKNYHSFLLEFYEKLHGPSLVDLILLGLISVLQDLFQQTYSSECTYETVRNLIYSLDGEICPKHSSKINDWETQNCPFLPTYRCSSPSYLQVQEENKILLSVRSTLMNQADGSPLSSNSNTPWGNALTSDEETLSGGFSPGGAPSGSYSPHSSTVGSDVDEGVFGESNVYPDSLFEYSEGEDITTDRQYVSLENRIKRRKLNHKFTPSSSIPSNEPPPENVDSPSTMLQDDRSRQMTIAAILRILKRLVHIEPFHPQLLNFVPSLLALLCNGKACCMKNESTVDSTLAKDESNLLAKECFYGADYLLKNFFQKIENFQPILESNFIPLINRLACIDKEKEDSNEELKKCNTLLKDLLLVLSGEKNGTNGWRIGFLLQSLLSTANPMLTQQASLAIPLLFEDDRNSLQKFQPGGQGWNELFSILSRADEIPDSVFQDTIMSLSSLCSAFGMCWEIERDEYSRRKQLSTNFDESQFDEDQTGSETKEIVILELDNGECISVEKECLTNSSPVFEAMFVGHFVETEEQRVKLRNTSGKGLRALIHQIQMQEQENVTTNNIDRIYDLKTIFEVFSLSNRFLLNDIHDKTFNSIITSYLCPYSAPAIYKNAVQMSPFEKPEEVRLSGPVDFPKLVLKYLLVDPGVSCGLKCSTFKKIFDSVEPSVVIRDLKQIFEISATSRSPFPSMQQRRKRNSLNIMLKM